ncbi:MAG: virulence RhuM family protein [Bacteroidales bacterium]|nr:virulence RhuM family protein [Bacteroidales bacterium]
MQETNLIIYKSENKNISVQVQYEDGTFWLTQKRMAELYGVDVATINYHLKEIYKTSELEQERTIRKIQIVQREGKRDVSRNLDFYNLDTIIAVGYRVNSFQATKFCATNPIVE